MKPGDTFYIHDVVKKRNMLAFLDIARRFIEENPELQIAFTPDGRSIYRSTIAENPEIATNKIYKYMYDSRITTHDKLQLKRATGSTEEEIQKLISDKILYEYQSLNGKTLIIAHLRNF